MPVKRMCECRAHRLDAHRAVLILAEDCGGGLEMRDHPGGGEVDHGAGCGCGISHVFMVGIDGAVDVPDGDADEGESACSIAQIKSRCGICSTKR